MKQKRIPIIYAPTATGKTDIIMQLSTVVDMEICSMDSMQIYRKMDIGTAKPTAEELRKFPHHLLNIVDPDEDYDVNRYRNDALSAIDQITTRGNIPLFVGGTGLYMDALRYGLFEGVTRDDSLRNELVKKEAASPGILMELLRKADPEAASKIHSNDLKRKIRALEVYYLTGRKFSEMGQQRTPDERFLLIYLSRNRQDIYARINKRVEIMIKKGLLEETERLMEQYTPDLQSMKAIGYRETIEYLMGKYDSKEEYIDTLQKNTRHYAKRQIIWSRRYDEMNHINIDSKSTVRICEEIVDLINAS